MKQRAPILTPSHILAAVAEVLDVPAVKMASAAKTDDVVHAREIYAGACRRATVATFIEMTLAMGKREHQHTTLVYAARRCEAKLKDRDVQLSLEAVIHHAKRIAQERKKEGVGGTGCVCGWCGGDIRMQHTKGVPDD